MSSHVIRTSEQGVLTHDDQVVFLNSCKKLFIPRDYTKGLNVRFETEFPAKFTGIISRDTWEHTITTINRIFEEAESVSAESTLETLLGCFTCYCSRIVTKTVYEKKLKEFATFVAHQNEDIYHSSGIHIVNPMERGLRVIEICFLYTADENHANSGLRTM